jgi:aldose 1-epimerase
MYQHSTETFGKFEKHIVHNPETNNGFELVPEFGAILLSATFGGVNVIEGYTTPEDLEALHWAKNVVLYPFPNRMEDGKYEFEGKLYQFPINNAATNNAIHGLGKTKLHRVSSLVTAANYASITCTYEYVGHQEYYPFPFRFDIEFFMSDGNNMEIKMSFKNTGKGNLPVGIGWHPYFSLSENIADTELQMPDIQWIEIDERMLPTGEKRPYTDFVSLRKIGDTSLDNGFYIANQQEPFGVTLASERGKLRYWQEVGQDKYNFIQIFTPLHRTCIALEPMTCNINAFNNGDGLKILSPNETLSGVFGYNFYNKTK